MSDAVAALKFIPALHRLFLVFPAVILKADLTQRNKKIFKNGKKIYLHYGKITPVKLLKFVYPIALLVLTVNRLIYIYIFIYIYIYIYIFLGFKISPYSECCIIFGGVSPASKFYVPSFRSNLSVPC